MPGCVYLICSESLLSRDGCGQATGVVDAAFDSKDSLEAGVGAVVETPWLDVAYTSCKDIASGVHRALAPPPRRA